MVTTIMLLRLLDKNELTIDGLKREISPKNKDISWNSLVDATAKTVTTTESK